MSLTCVQWPHRGSSVIESKKVPLVDWFEPLTTLRTSLPSKATQVMSRQEADPENQQLALKRPRQEDRLIQHSRSSSIPSSIVSNVSTFDMSPFICGFQDKMSNWVNSLIQHQDGCLQMVAQQATYGRLRQEQLAHTIAQRAAMPSQHDQVSYLRAQRNSHIEKHS